MAEAELDKRLVVTQVVAGASPVGHPNRIWVGMYQGGDTPLHGACGKFDSCAIHDEM